VVAVTEYDPSCTTNNGYCVDAALQLDNTETVPAPVIAPVDPTSGGGGGGSMDPVFLILLGVMLCVLGLRRAGYAARVARRLPARLARIGGAAP